jgi:hypothetical protein
MLLSADRTRPSSPLQLYDCRDTRLAEGLLSVISSKFVLAASFALAIEALGQADSGQGMAGGFTTMIAGGAAFLIAALTLSAVSPHPDASHCFQPVGQPAAGERRDQQHALRGDGEDGDPDTHVWPLWTLGRRLRPSRDGAATGIRRSPHGCWR